MSDIAPYRITIEEDLRGRWHWRVADGAGYGAEGGSLYIEGFFRQYAFGEAKTRARAEWAARAFVARHRKFSEAKARDRAHRERTRMVIS